METANNIKLVEVPHAMIPDVWALVRDKIENICERGNGSYTPMDMLSMLLNRKIQLWTVLEDGNIDAITLTELVERPHLKECRIFATTGEDHKKWTHLVEQIELWAKMNGCHHIVAITRPGWERALKPFGYEKTHVELQKVLGNVH